MDSDLGSVTGKRDFVNCDNQVGEVLVGDSFDGAKKESFLLRALLLVLGYRRPSCHWPTGRNEGPSLECSWVG